MANPLARVIMDNMARKSGMVQSQPSFSGQRVHLNEHEEDLLVDLLNKRTTATTRKGLNSLNDLVKNRNVATNTNDSINRNTNSAPRVTLEDLVKKGHRTEEIKEVNIQQKTNTMMTLDQLAGKARKTKDTDINTSQNKEKANYESNYGVKKSVINNLEAYIPKVSLDSIGKKGSLKW